MDRDIAELQMLLMDQQKTLESLSDQLVSHSRRFSKLETSLHALQEKLDRLHGPEQSGQKTENESPPHY